MRLIFAATLVICTLPAFGQNEVHLPAPTPTPFIRPNPTPSPTPVASVLCGAPSIVEGTTGQAVSLTCTVTGRTEATVAWTSKPVMLLSTVSNPSYVLTDSHDSDTLDNNFNVLVCGNADCTIRGMIPFNDTGLGAGTFATFGTISATFNSVNFTGTVHVSNFLTDCALVNSSTNEGTCTFSVKLSLS